MLYPRLKQHLVIDAVAYHSQYVLFIGDKVYFLFILIDDDHIMLLVRKPLHQGISHITAAYYDNVHASSSDVRHSASISADALPILLSLYCLLIKYEYNIISIFILFLFRYDQGFKLFGRHSLREVMPLYNAASILF